MRIGMDGVPFRKPRTGIGRYTINLLDRLLAQGDDRFELFVIGRDPIPEPAAGVRICHTRLPASVLELFWRTLGGPAVERWLPGIEVYHGVNFWLPPLRKARGIITVHDLAFLLMPDLHTPWQRALAHRLKNTLRYCTRVIAVSENTRNDFHRFFEFPKEKVHVIPEAAAPVFRRNGGAPPGLPEDYVLCVSSSEPRKNLPRLVEAFARASPTPHLVLVGPDRTAALDKAIRTHSLEKRVHLTGPMQDEELVGVYNHARCLAYPSLYEGFGLPVLEAMACGTPVICPRNSCFPEVAEDAALYCDAEDVDSIADALRRLAGDEALARTCSERGLEQAARFTWERTAKETRRVYELALKD